LRKRFSWVVANMVSLRFPQRLKLVILCLLSGVFSSIFVAMDIYYLNIVMPDPIVYGLLTEWIGLAFSFLLMIFFSIPFKEGKTIGYFLDPTFDRVKLPRGKILLYLIGAGLSASFSTFSYFILTSITDPSTILPLSKLVIVYLLVAEIFYEKDAPTYIEIISISLIIMGVFLVSFVKAGFGFMETLIILGPYNLGLTFYTYFQKIARDCREEGITNDSLNLRIWSLFFLTLFMSIFSIPLIDDTRWNLIIRYGQDTYSLIFIIIDMSFAFFAYIFYLRALGMGKMSVVNSITSISVVLGIPLTLIGNIIYPGAFGVIPTELEIWVFKTIGSILVIEGIVALSITQERSYILIKMKYPYELDIMPLLKQIKGVESVAAVAGNYDYILRVKIRSIAKVYNMLVRKIEKLPAIKEITTMKIIKEWEKI